MRRFGERLAILPLDPVSDGTWIAVNDAGVVLTLLNVNPALRPREAVLANVTTHHDEVVTYPTARSTHALVAAPDVPCVEEQIYALDRFTEADASRRHSRGLIIPAHLHLSTADEVADLAYLLNPLDYPPFRLVVADDSVIWEFHSDGATIRQSATQSSSRPLFFTSSGLGDHVVEAPRRKLFDEWFADAPDYAARQDEFHRHAWSDRPHVSVCMSRDDARTVSHTVVEVHPDRVVLRYLNEAPNRPVEAVTRELARKALHE